MLKWAIPALAFSVFVDLLGRLLAEEPPTIWDCAAAALICVCGALRTANYEAEPLHLQHPEE